jgi:sigma-B regulation protein RsbU (phosphoserine phosphatase)
MKKKDRHSQVRKGSKIAKVIWDDLHSGIFRRSVWEDVREIYRFYVDSETRARHAAMGRVRRWIHGISAVLKSLILKLNPIRRILLVLSLILSFLAGRFSLGENGNVSFDLRMAGYCLLVLILVLELKDKLLARDELAAGRSVQFALLPRDPPDIIGWDVWLYTRPANEVGGDLVDYTEMEDGRLGIVLGDVAGKGLGAALYMAKLQAVWRVLAPDMRSIPELGRRLNLSFCRDGLPNRFVSLIYTDLFPESGKIRIMNAGHLPALIRRKDHILEIAQGAPALGLSPASEYSEESLTLAAGEMVLLYSDGMTEARNARGEFFGEERLKALFSDCPALDIESAGRSILAAIDRFVGDEKANDDLSMILIRRRGE